MRTAFIEELCKIAAEDEKVWLLTGDLGFSVLERFAEKFPERFINVGVAEQNLMGVAAGLALSGKKVFAYSIVNFATLRCYEQIRNDICYHNANVNIVAAGGGLAYGAQGYTHHGVEDMAVMRVLPNITAIAPGDPIETRLATRAIFEKDGPCYLAMGKSREPVVHESDPEFHLGRAIILSEGTDATIISNGCMLNEAATACEILKDQNVSCGLTSMHTLAPFDESAILQAAKTPLVITVEERTEGGLGSAAAEVLASTQANVPFMPLRLPREYAGPVGSREYLREMYGISAEKIADAIMERLKKA